MERRREGVTGRRTDLKHDYVSARVAVGPQVPQVHSSSRAAHRVGPSFRLLPYSFPSLRFSFPPHYGFEAGAVSGAVVLDAAGAADAALSLAASRSCWALASSAVWKCKSEASFLSLSKVRSTPTQ